MPLGLATPHRDNGFEPVNFVLTGRYSSTSLWSPKVWEEMAFIILNWFVILSLKLQWSQHVKTKLPKLLLFSMPCQVINGYCISFTELLSPGPGQWLCFLGIGGQLLKAASVWLKWFAQAISLLLISSFATSLATAVNKDLLTSSWTNTSRTMERATQTHLSSLSLHPVCWFHPLLCRICIFSK